MANQFPGSEYVGIDLSAVQIAAAQSTIEALQLDNVRLLHVDLRSLPVDLGMFDYVIAHGVYSWVSDETQHALLKLCSQRLTPHGVAYVSYNTYPGWHMRGMIRDMMSYRVRSIESPIQQIHEARALLRFLAESLDPQQSPYGMLLHNELETLKFQDDSYLFHEHLEEHNAPVYFYEFAERANAVGLQYLGEEPFSLMFVETFSERVESVLRGIASTLVEAEQYMDFVRNRMFRQTLLCRQEIVLDRSLPPERAAPMSAASVTRPESLVVDLSANVEMKFRSGTSTATTSDPLTKAALLCLGELWPKYVALPDLFDLAQQRIGNDSKAFGTADPKQKFTLLAESLLGCCANGHIDLSIAPPQFETEVNEKPMASKLARYQATKQTVATNQLHVDIQLHEHERCLLCKLDGQHNTSSLVDHLVSLIKDGTLRLTNEQSLAEHSQEIRQAAMLATRAALNRFAECGLLV